MVDPPAPVRTSTLSLRATLDSAGVAIAAIGLEGHVLSASSEFARAFCRTPDDLVGVHLIGLCTPSDQPEVLAGLSRVVGGTSRLERCTVRVHDDSGATTTLRCTVARPDGDDHEIVVILGAALTPAAPDSIVAMDRRRRTPGRGEAPSAPPDSSARVHLAPDTAGLVASALGRSGHQGTPFALIRVGLDGISTEGAGGRAHPSPADASTTDDVLAALGDRMLRRLRPSDRVCRDDRDGFAVLAEDLGDVQDAAGVAYRLLSMAVEPLAVRGGPARVALTVGVAVADAGGSADEIPAAADRALAEARADGIGGFRIVDLRSGRAA